MKRAFFLTIEFVSVFAGMPLLIYWGVLPNWPVAMLLIVVCGAFFVLRRDATFDQRRLMRFAGVREGIGPLLIRDVVLLILLGLVVWWWRPDLLFSLLKRSPVLWAAIMVLYPVISVYPQELLFRTYFFHRYEALFGTRLRMIAASALAFGFVHIVFGNWISVALCTIGGVLFALTYERTGSLALTCIEHALFGNFIFTIGLGKFFVPGARH
jgi:membrane protease YdiL (CAAX protease family)